MVFANNTNASEEVLQKEAFELYEAAKELHKQTSRGCATISSDTVQ